MKRLAIFFTSIIIFASCRKENVSGSNVNATIDQIKTDDLPNHSTIELASSACSESQKSRTDTMLHLVKVITGIDAAKNIIHKETAEKVLTKVVQALGSGFALHLHNDETESNVKQSYFKVANIKKDIDLPSKIERDGGMHKLTINQFQIGKINEDSPDPKIDDINDKFLVLMQQVTNTEATIKIDEHEKIFPVNNSFEVEVVPFVTNEKVKMAFCRFDIKRKLKVRDGKCSGFLGNPKCDIFNKDVKHEVEKVVLATLHGEKLQSQISSLFTRDAIATYLPGLAQELTSEVIKNNPVCNNAPWLCPFK